MRAVRPLQARHTVTYRHTVGRRYSRPERKMHKQELAELTAAFASDVERAHNGNQDSLKRLLLSSDVVLSYADGMLFTLVCRTAARILVVSCQAYLM